MSSADDSQFLAKLVHRGHLNQEHAKTLLPRLQSGESLDVLLEEVLEWDTKEVERLRRTDAGEIPEIPGYQILGNLGTGGTADVWRAREKKTSAGTGTARSKHSNPETKREDVACYCKSDQCP